MVILSAMEKNSVNNYRICKQIHMLKMKKKSRNSWKSGCHKLYLKESKMGNKTRINDGKVREERQMIF